MPGFAEQIAGMEKEAEKEFKLKLPSDYAKNELAGKEPSFKVKVVEVKQEILPELDDDFVTQVDPDLNTLDELKERLKTNLRLRAEEKARIDFEEKVIEAVVGLAKVEFPPIMEELEIDRLINQQMQRWQMSGQGLEEYLKSINRTEEELREELRPLAAKRVTRSLVLEKVAKEEKIEVNDAEIDAEIEKMIENTKDANKEQLQKFWDSPQARQSVAQFLTTQKTVQQLIFIASGSSSKIDNKVTPKEDEKE